MAWRFGVEVGTVLCTPQHHFDVWIALRTKDHGGYLIS
jgi:hypothetical protein